LIHDYQPLLKDSARQERGRQGQTQHLLVPTNLMLGGNGNSYESVKEKGEYTLLSRATDMKGNQQPMNANWNVLGYGNNGVREHAVTVQII